MKVDRALLATGAYIALQEALRPLLFSVFEWQNCGGTPCWRAALTMLPQFLLLPLAIGIAALQHATLQDWCADSATRGLDTAARCVVYFFYTFLLLDFVYVYVHWPTVVLRRLMIDHHLLCLAGHLYGASVGAAAARPCYIFAICCLEVGSGTANAFWLLRGTRYTLHGALTYLVCMTLSNGTASTLAWCWQCAARDAGTHWLKRALCVVIVALLVYLRQVEVHKLTLPLLVGEESPLQPSE